MFRCGSFWGDQTWQNRWGRAGTDRSNRLTIQRSHGEQMNLGQPRATGDSSADKTARCLAQGRTGGSWVLGVNRRAPADKVQSRTTRLQNQWT